ncbi:RluA family pseudouridine synthase [Companilactobacillus kedongensis]|uniref:RluA family pseudouridine synthase n=1 Tax=Companilactobacillus kedongensis TaxID=2486004 RepID=UPI000F7B2A4D|nr:RluA family pseudouridine synthase [Companilactobacillus kedongensis]
MYQKNITYKQARTEKLSVRELLQKWLVPKKWQHFLRVEQNILINGQYQAFNTIIKNNDLVTMNFDFDPRTSQHYLPGSGKLNVAYENDDLLVVNKPAGQKTHPNLNSEDNTLFNDAESHLNKYGQHPYMVHRIDQETSGLVLISKTPYLVPIFNRQLSSKTLQREYLAIVDLKQPIENSGVIDQPIGLDPDDKRKRMVRTDGQNAKTEYHVISKNSKQALLNLKLYTGRTHQLRVHLSHNGWPIVNDPLYNPQPQNGLLKLFAYKLIYQIPFTDLTKTVQVDIPYFMKLDKETTN